GTRRRARFAVSSRGVGFRRRTSHQLVNLEECYVLDPRLFACVAPLRRNAPLFWPRGGQGAATVQWAEAGADLLLDMAAPPDLATLEHLARFAEAQDLARLSWRAPGSGLATPVAERRPVQVIFAGVAVDLPPDSFLQASVEAEAALTSAVLEAVGSASRIADLYAGLGTFTFALAARAHLHAVEVSKPAIASLSRAASRAGLAHRITTERRDLTLSPLSPQELGRFDAVLFDPPRAGAREQALCIARAQIPLVVAISCDPATFARDARTLLDGGYRLTRVLPIDQFPWSPHVELIAVFAGP
ncbi:MAG TPA: class I SAM-dependent RNA methyltransferase, partial [Stellaceae bacterium]|nr:class I SAM-dependent RNA methyltransferase [Stellaceae bacterium]